MLHNGVCTQARFLNLNAYFSRQHYVVEDVPLDGLGFRELWKRLRCFGDDSAMGTMWDTRTGPNSSLPLQHLRLGESADLDRYFPDLKTTIAGGIYCESSKGISDLGFGQYPSSVWGSAIPTPAYVYFSASERWLQRIAPPILLDMLFNFWSVLDTFKPDFGLVDYSLGSLNLNGGTFGGVTDLETPLQEWVIKSRWYQEGWKSGKVRSVYWGNYLTNRMLEQLGGCDDFLTRFIENTKSPNGQQTSVAWRFDNGAFIALSPNPTFAFVDYDLCCFNTDYYIKELILANLI